MHKPLSLGWLFRSVGSYRVHETVRHRSFCRGHLTAAFDIYGQRFFSPELFSSSFTDSGHYSDLACSPAHANLAVRTVDHNIVNASFGLKYRVMRNLAITANVLAKLDNHGLRSPAVPRFGASYSF